MRLRPLSLVLALLLAGQAHAQQQADTPAQQGQDIAAVDDPDGAESVSRQVPLAEIRRFVSV